MQFQTKVGISDGARRVTYYDSWGIVSCDFIFLIADPSEGLVVAWSQALPGPRDQECDIPSRWLGWENLSV